MLRALAVRRPQIPVFQQIVNRFAANIVVNGIEAWAAGNGGREVVHVEEGVQSALCAKTEPGNGHPSGIDKPLLIQQLHSHIQRLLYRALLAIAWPAHLLRDLAPVPRS